MTAKKTAPVKATGKPAGKSAPVAVKAKPKGKAPVAAKKAKGAVKAESAPKTAAPKAQTALTPSQERFVLEYLIDLNGTQAYMRSFPNAAEPSARVQACRLLADPNIAAAVQAGKDARAQRTQLTADMVVNRLRDIAYADARDISAFHVYCCRYCWGAGHRWQRTETEMEYDRQNHKPEKGEFDEKGGAGFKVTREPNPECPECAGLGKGRAIIRDTRNLSPGAAALYAGIKETKEGLEVKTNDQMSALDKLARHTGAYEADNEQQATVLVTPDALNAIYERKMAESRQLGEHARGRLARLGIVPQPPKTLAKKAAKASAK